MSGSIEKAREVTKALADLDLYFAFGRNVDGGDPLWNLLPFSTQDGANETEATQGIGIQLLLTDAWLFVYHLRPLLVQPKEETLTEWLRMNTRFSGARIGLWPNTNGKVDSLIVSTEISPSQINAETVREAISNVLGISRHVVANSPV